MRVVYQAELLSILLVSSLAYGQEPGNLTSQPVPPPLELRLTKSPRWNGNCFELKVQRTNLSESSIFLDATYEGIKIYSSVSDVTNTLGQGPGEAWMLVYGWTDVVSEPIELAPGARRQNTLCIADAFPVKETGEETLRQLRVRGKLRIVAGYEIPTWRTICQPLGKGRRAYLRVAEIPSRWTLGEVVLKIPIPCPNGINETDCLLPPQIFPGEHDVHRLEIAPPTIEIQPLPLSILPIDRPPPPKPE
jgi:hypothetical protein